MVSVGVQIVIVLVCWIVAVSATLPTANEQEKIVSSHNAYRKAAGASDMMEMSWDDNLANAANTLVTQCANEHTQLANSYFRDGFWYVGENLYAATAMSSSVDWDKVVTEWHSEKINYTYSSNSCKHICGHYTQVVWASTFKVGCAFAQCPNEKYKLQVACQYGPGGNQMGEKPYAEGTSCDACPSGTLCTDDNKLCIGPPPCADQKTFCNLFANDGSCPPEYRRYFAVNCKKSCNLCEYA